MSRRAVAPSSSFSKARSCPRSRRWSNAPREADAVLAPLSPRQLLTLAFTTASQAAAPSVCLAPALSGLQRRPAVVLGAGKAAASMAAAFHAHWGAPVRGMVVTRYGHGLLPGEQCGGIEVIEAGHPSPDSASLGAGERLLSLAAGVGRDETLICL